MCYCFVDPLGHTKLKKSKAHSIIVVIIIFSPVGRISVQLRNKAERYIFWYMALSFTASSMTGK